jgi:hypothetical protein
MYCRNMIFRAGIAIISCRSLPVDLLRSSIIALDDAAPPSIAWIGEVARR